MAPRGRSKKRDTRMGAAVDAMTKNFGFSEELVKKVANELLKEYGGEDGWFFIEQYSYQELLEAIFRYQDENPQEKKRLENSGGGGDSVESNSLLGGTAGNHVPTDAAGPSTVVAGPVCSKNGLEKGTKEDNSYLLSTERYRKVWKDIGLDQSSGKRDISNAVCDIVENCGSNENPPTTSIVPSRPDTSPLLSPVQVIRSSATADSTPPRRRLPCYGWIESDEEDVDDFIELKPVQATATTAAESGEYLSCRMDTKANSRSRWDLKPDDP